MIAYEIKQNGFLGKSKEVDPKDGIGYGWTYDAPPEGKIVRWHSGQWVEEAQEHSTELFIGRNSMSPEDVRTIRKPLLSDSDWTQLPDAPLTAEQKAAWAKYRQDLRDVTDQVDLNNIVWPTPPAN